MQLTPSEFIDVVDQVTEALNSRLEANLVALRYRGYQTKSEQERVEFVAKVLCCIEAFSELPDQLREKLWFGL